MAKKTAAKTKKKTTPKTAKTATPKNSDKDVEKDLANETPDADTTSETSTNQNGAEAFDTPPDTDTKKADSTDQVTKSEDGQELPKVEVIRIQCQDNKVIGGSLTTMLEKTFTNHFAESKTTILSSDAAKFGLQVVEEEVIVKNDKGKDEKSTQRVVSLIQ